MAPELSKAALGLHPLIPTYAVDCDAQKNKALCAEQGVQGFPTVKVRLSDSSTTLEISVLIIRFFSSSPAVAR